MVQAIPQPMTFDEFIDFDDGNELHEAEGKWQNEL
jgi:hypothetical protein